MDVPKEPFYGVYASLSDRIEFGKDMYETRVKAEQIANEMAVRRVGRLFVVMRSILVIRQPRAPIVTMQYSSDDHMLRGMNEIIDSRD